MDLCSPIGTNDTNGRNKKSKKQKRDEKAASEGIKHLSEACAKKRDMAYEEEKWLAPKRGGFLLFASVAFGSGSHHPMVRGKGSGNGSFPCRRAGRPNECRPTVENRGFSRSEA